MNNLRDSKRGKSVDVATLEVILGEKDLQEAKVRFQQAAQEILSLKASYTSEAEKLAKKYSNASYPITKLIVKPSIFSISVSSSSISTNLASQKKLFTKAKDEVDSFLARMGTLAYRSTQSYIKSDSKKLFDKYWNNSSTSFEKYFIEADKIKEFETIVGNATFEIVRIKRLESEYLKTQPQLQLETVKTAEVVTVDSLAVSEPKKSNAGLIAAVVAAVVGAVYYYTEGKS